MDIRIWKSKKALAKARCISVIALSVLFGIGPIVAPSSAFAQQTGYAVKKPIFGGACKSCPWGALADIAKKAMAPYGWDVQVCYTCAGGLVEERIVSEVRHPPPYKTSNPPSPLTAPPPDGPVDFGVINNNYMKLALRGGDVVGGDPPRKNLRLVANIAGNTYLTVAVRSDLGISDLSQLKTNPRPLKVMLDRHRDIALDVLAYFGVSEQDLKAAGDNVVDNHGPADRHGVDVAIFLSDLSGTPEYQVGYDVTANNKLAYLQLPDALLKQLSVKYELAPDTMPVGYFLGMDKEIHTIGIDGNSYYGRTDMPDDFAYTLAKALYEQQVLFDGGLQHYSYHPQTVWKMGDMPLAPGAAKFYREMEFMK